MYFAFQFQRVALFVSVCQGLCFFGKHLYFNSSVPLCIIFMNFDVCVGVGNGKHFVSEWWLFVRGLGKGFFICYTISFRFKFHFHHIIMMPCISFSSSRCLVCSVYSLLSLPGIYTNHSSFISFISSHASFGIVNKLVKDTNAFSLFLISLWIT